MIGQPIDTINVVKKCERCGLRYPVDKNKCNHCSHLNESELALLKIEIKKQRELNRGLGKYFIFATIALILFILLIVSFK